MKRSFLCCLLLLALSALPPLPRPASAAVALSKTLPLYARDMEFYYLKPRPETLPGILRVFDAQGALADNRKQLTLAAFFAQVLRANADARQRLLPPPDTLGRNGRRTLAWAAHMAQLPDETALLDRLLTPEDRLLRGQISRSPAPLSAWDIRSEPTVVQMYWTGFMASGDTALLDAIINAALRYAALKAAGMQNDRAFAVCAAAASSLYELAPRHPAVTARLEQFLQRHSGPEAETLRAILRK